MFNLTLTDKKKHCLKKRIQANDINVMFIYLFFLSLIPEQGHGLVDYMGKHANFIAL